MTPFVTFQTITAARRQTGWRPHLLLLSATFQWSPVCIVLSQSRGEMLWIKPTHEALSPRCVSLKPKRESEGECWAESHIHWFNTRVWKRHLVSPHPLRPRHRPSLTLFVLIPFSCLSFSGAPFLFFYFFIFLPFSLLLLLCLIFAVKKNHTEYLSGVAAAVCHCEKMMSVMWLWLKSNSNQSTSPPSQ